MTHIDIALNKSAKLEIVLDRDLFEVADEDFDAEVPAAGKRQPHAVDPPVRRPRRELRCSRSGSIPAAGLGQNELDLLRCKGTKLTVEQTDCDPPSG